MCLSDIDIEGIDTIRLVNGKDKCPAQYSQIEYFRKDIFPKNASIFAVDLDCIPVKEFTLPRCQPNSIAMTMEYWQKPHHPVWNGIWNCGAMYFNGDFSDLYNCYIDRINGKLGNLPPYSCTSIQEFITLVLFKYDFHIYDLLRYVQIQLASADFKVAKNVPIKDHSSLYHFLASPKPWTMTVEDTKLQRAIHRIYKLGWRLAEHLIDNDIIELS